MTGMIIFTAEEKKGQGKGAARDLRRQNRIPAIIYGGKEQFMLSLEQKEFVKEYLKGNIQSKLMELHIGSKKITVIPREVQINPVTDMPEHIDFQEVNQDTTIKVAIHVKVLNDDKCPGIKKGGVMNVAQRMIRFSCHPQNIPTHIEVDIAKLEIGHNIHIQDIALPAGIKPIDSSNFVILSISGRVSEQDAAAEGAGATTDKK